MSSGKYNYYGTWGIRQYGVTNMEPSFKELNEDPVPMKGVAICTNCKPRMELEESQIRCFGGLIKNVRLTKTTCPHCGYALFWRLMPVNKVKEDAQMDYARRMVEEYDEKYRRSK